METKRIYKISMAQYLIDNGCHLIRVVQDVFDLEKKNWIFEDTPKLREKMAEFTSQISH